MLHLKIKFNDKNELSGNIKKLSIRFKFIFEQMRKVLLAKTQVSPEVFRTCISIEFEVDFPTWAKSLFREFIMSIRLCPVGEVISGYVVSLRFGTFATQFCFPRTHRFIHVKQTTMCLLRFHLYSNDYIYILVFSRDLLNKETDLELLLINTGYRIFLYCRVPQVKGYQKHTSKGIMRMTMD